MVSFRRFQTEPKAADALYNELARVMSPGVRVPTEGQSAAVAGPAAAPVVVMLAGGRTPLSVYRRLADEPPQEVHPALHLMPSDDRYVPRDDPRSNVGAIEPLADALRLASDRLVGLDSREPLDRAVSSWSGSIEHLARRRSVFALAILGIGADGHTASLFSRDEVDDRSASGAGSGLLEVNGHASRLTMTTGEHSGTMRVSVAPRVILAFKRLVFFATGPAKRDILYEISRRPDEYPAGRIMVQHANAEIWTDVAPVVR